MHPSVRPFAEYLSLPAGFGPEGGLIWTNDGTAIEEENGQVFIFTKQLADFIEGFASVAPVPHFGHMIECWHMLGLNPPKHAPQRERLRQLAIVFRGSNSPARNAGVFFARHTTGVARAVNVPPGGGHAITHFLTHSNSLGLLHPKGPGNAEVPDRTALVLWQRVADNLSRQSDQELRHAFRHGSPPTEAPVEQVVEIIEQKPPPTLLEFLDEAVKDRARLRGSVPMVRQLVAALSLPPRRRHSQMLPVGGYADITNRGRPDRLLPSQLALDPDDFVRRFAEQELLYFQKEDPHERERETLSLVLDQGVRTWGAVRQMLAASLLAFGRMADNKRMPLHVRFTSAPAERFSPPEGDANRFGNLLEASDLTPHPTAALAEEMNEAEDTPRDIVLLTHPATLTEPALLELPTLLPKNHRLFALAISEEGDIELAEVRPGGAVTIKRLRMQLPRSSQHQNGPSRPVSTILGPWLGDVEPTPSPFRLGPIHGIEHLSFDANNEHLMLVTKHGHVYLLHLATKEMEMLPRGHLYSPLSEPLSVVGLRDGFVIGGRTNGTISLFHYCLSNQVVTRIPAFEHHGSGPLTLHSFPDLDCVVAKSNLVRAFDVGNRSRFPAADNQPHAYQVARAKTAYEQFLILGRQPVDSLPLGLLDPNATLPPGPWFRHDPKTGELVFRPKTDAGIHHETPLSDGKPVYRGARVQRVMVAGDTMAVASSNQTYRNQDTVWRLFDLRDGRMIKEAPLTFPWMAQAVLSHDGRLFASKTGSCELTVHQLTERSDQFKTSQGHCHTNAEIQLFPRHLDVMIGKELFRLDWHGPELWIHRVTNDQFAETPTAERTKGAPAGFRMSAKAGDLEAMLDVFGQVALRKKTLLAMILVYQGQFCFWMPDGTRHGPAHLTGGPETPDAKERLWVALRSSDS